MLTKQIFEYNGNKITFRKGEYLMVNATEMARPFGKLAKDWLKTQPALNYIQALSKSKRNIILLADLVKVIQGGSNPGTWMHEDVALEFARWLSPDFAIWCNDRVKELMKHGFTATSATIDEMINNPDFAIRLLTNLKEEREARNLAESKNRELIPKAELMDKVLDADEKIDIGQAAKILELPFGRNTLFRKLREDGVFFKNRNEPRQEYIRRGYFVLKEKFIERDNHEGFVVVKVLVTQKGLEFLSKLLGVVISQKKLALIR